jgi:hypothetical protein
MGDAASRCFPNIRWHTATIRAVAAGMARLGLAAATLVAETHPIQHRGTTECITGVHLNKDG